MTTTNEDGEPNYVWPIDSADVYAWREKQLACWEDDPVKMAMALSYYKYNPKAFINHWYDTYDPRRSARKLPSHIPLVMFARQEALVDFVVACAQQEESGLIEKSRDMGATWVCCGISTWMFLFWDGTATGWGSRKQELVDRLGDPTSIFEKLRIGIRRLPKVFLPEGFDDDRHMHFMRIINPANGASIIGETGDSIGRGGRTTVYFKDEAAHYAHAESIEAALMENTRCQIDISSVNGTGNIFYRRRDAGVEWEPGQDLAVGKTNVFIMDWSHHPDKTREWFERKREKAISDGLLHVFAQEIERNYAASVEGIIIQPEWVQSAIDAHLKLGIEPTGKLISALDVADGGNDTNAQAAGRGILIDFLDEWSVRDTGVTARKALANCKTIAGDEDLEFQYDALNVGAGVKAEINRLLDDDNLPFNFQIMPWVAGAQPLDPGGRVIPNDKKSPINKNFFHNLKAQAWWQTARRFERTHKAVTDPTFKYDPDDLISISSKVKMLGKLIKELSQATITQSSTMKLLVNKTPDGSKSPNLADAVIMKSWPVRKLRTSRRGSGVTVFEPGQQLGEASRRTRRR